MWARVCFSMNVNPPFTSGRSFDCRTNPKSLKLRSSLSDYPLASRILIRNLPYSISESCLSKEFSTFGEIAEVNLEKDSYTKRPKGHAFIQYTCQDDAILALEEMDSKMFGGRVIYVELARPPKNTLGGKPKTCGPPIKVEDVSTKPDKERND